MLDQYWPDDGAAEDELPDQYWPEPVFTSPWDDYDSDPIKDIHVYAAKLAATFKRSTVIYSARGFGKGVALHRALEDEARHDSHHHKSHLSDHNPAAAHVDLASGAGRINYLIADGKIHVPGSSEELEEDLRNYRTLPNGREMPIVSRGSGPAAQPFKKRGKR